MNHILFLLFAINVYANDVYLPQQVHLSYTNNPTEMMITWNTVDNPKVSTVKYSIASSKHQLSESTTTDNITMFVDDGDLKRIQYINRVLLTNLTLGEKYIYVCGTNEYGWSSVYHFVAMKDFSKTKEPLRILAYGDLGDVNAVSLSQLQNIVETKNIDAILHIGDFAYDLLDNNGLVGDQFMMDIEPIAAYTPYMTAVGNHEAGYNYSHYINRFTMPNFPNNNGNMLYSWNIGPAHIISFSSEVYFKPNTRIVTKDYPPIKSQFNWLVDDLTRANLPNNRKNQPWIITMAHRPLYCSNLGYDACAWEINPMREGLLYDSKIRLGLDSLFYNYKVDLELWGHEHTYERSYPLYRHIPYTSNITNVNHTSYYYNPIAPVHIITGACGNKEMTGAPVPFTNNTWSASRSYSYGFSYMEIYNYTHLHISQINGRNGTVIDELWIIK